MRMENASAEGWWMVKEYRIAFGAPTISNVRADPLTNGCLFTGYQHDGGSKSVPTCIRKVYTLMCIRSILGLSNFYFGSRCGDIHNTVTIRFCGVQSSFCNHNVVAILAATANSHH